MTVTIAILIGAAIGLAFGGGVILSTKVMTRIAAAERAINYVQNWTNQETAAIHDRITALEKALKGKK